MRSKLRQSLDLWAQHHAEKITELMLPPKRGAQNGDRFHVPTVTPFSRRGPNALLEITLTRKNALWQYHSWELKVSVIVEPGILLDIALSPSKDGLRLDISTRFGAKFGVEKTIYPAKRDDIEKYFGVLDLAYRCMENRCKEWADLEVKSRGWLCGIHAGKWYASHRPEVVS